MIDYRFPARNARVKYIQISDPEIPSKYNQFHIYLKFNQLS